MVRMRGEASMDRSAPSAMARTLGALFLAGALTGALTVLLPHPAAADDTVLWSNVALALAGSLALLAVSRAGWLRAWMCQIAIAVGTLLITRAIVAGGDVDLYSFWYLWVGLYAFFYFGRWWGFAHMAVVGSAYAYALIQEPPPSPLAHWVMTVGTITVAGVLIDILASRVRRQVDQADARSRALSAVATVAHELSRRTSPVSAAPAVCESALEVTGAAEAVLWEPNRKGDALVATASTAPDAKGEVIPFLSTPSGVVQAFATGEPQFVRDSTSSDVPVLARAAPGSALYRPVSREGTPIGVLAIHWIERFDAIPEEAGWVVGLLAVEAAIAIERAETLSRLELVASTDDLTGLENRRAWDAHLKREVARARRAGSPLAVALLDLDHFKRYNDRYGHQAGDRLLKEVAANWQRAIRDTDILARYGGEEFALALPGADLEGAIRLLERLRGVTPKGERVSAGVVQWDGRESEHELIARADGALYSAKRGGRDRIVSA
jgi:diguanylate cyclase (GGDEF)-like protein